MDLLPSPDQASIAEAVAQLLDDVAPIEVARTYDPTAGSPPGWDPLADMGVFGLAVPEDRGGAGLGLAEEVLVFAELGRRLTVGPLLGTVLAAHLAAELDVDVVDRLVTGELTAGLVAAPDGLALDASVTGSATALDATQAEVLVVLTPEGAALVRTSDIELRPRACLDPLVDLADVAFDRAPVMASSAGGTSWWRASLLVAASQVGIAEAALADAVAHASVREQFGQIIGGFQAVKHRCAEMAARAEVARFQVAYAALEGELADPTSSLHIASARIVASDASRANAADNIVIHGAMGFSDESVAHLFARRAEVLDEVAGSRRWSLETLSGLPPLPSIHG